MTTEITETMLEVVQKMKTVDCEVESDLETVDPGTIRAIKVFPQKLFRPRSLQIEESVPGTTRILGAFVGQKHQFNAPSDGPDGVFHGQQSSRYASARDVMWDTCEASFPINFLVVSDAPSRVTWRARIGGKMRAADVSWNANESTAAPDAAAGSVKVPNWTLTTEAITIAPGKLGVTVVQVWPHVLFRVGKIRIDESIPGSTRVIAAFVGTNTQMPRLEGGGVKSGDTDYWSNVYFDACDKALAITFWLVSDADVPVTWQADLHGSR